jgi:hypothetical protein
MKNVPPGWFCPAVSCLFFADCGDIEGEIVGQLRRWFDLVDIIH